VNLVCLKEVCNGTFYSLARNGCLCFVKCTSCGVWLYLFAESLVKSAIVSSAESAFGAEVNVADVELGYSPLQLSVLGMQVTDKERQAKTYLVLNGRLLGWMFGNIYSVKLLLISLK